MEWICAAQIVFFNALLAHSCACSKGSAGDGPHSSSGTNVAEANLVALVESEDGLATIHAWTTTDLKAFDSMAEANRRFLRDAVLNGLDVAEMKYRIGCTGKEIAKMFDVSRSKLHHDLAAFVDYLDFIGHERAFNPTEDRNGSRVGIDACVNRNSNRSTLYFSSRRQPISKNATSNPCACATPA